MKPIIRLPSLLLMTLFASLVSLPATAQEGDMFPTKTAAQQRAKHLQCTGVFQMGDQWMPCADFNAYEKAVKHEQ